MKLYIVRHGESVNNQEHRFTGWSDAPLNDNGRAQAQRLNEFFKDKDIDCVFSSDLSRALETAKTALGVRPICTTPYLREINVGRLADRSINDCYKAFPTLNEDHKTLDLVKYGGENIQAVNKRIENFLNLLFEKKNQNVAVFSHGTYIKLLLKYLLEFEIDLTTLKISNCSVIVLEYIDVQWRLCESDFDKNLQEILCTT